MSTDTSPVIMKYGDFQFSAKSGYPVPMISIGQDYQRDGAGRCVGATVNITLEGQIFASGASGLAYLLTKESGLRDAFTYDGRTFSFGCNTDNYKYSGIKINRYSANKSSNNWMSTIDYSIELVSEVANTGSGIFYVTSTQDDWTLEVLDENSYAQGAFNLSLLNSNRVMPFDQGKEYPFYRITRTLGAIGKYTFLPSDNKPTPPTGGTTAISRAKEWVNYQLSSYPTFTGIINDTNIKLFNFARNINASEVAGSYSITDSWIGIPTSANNNPYIDAFTVESVLDSNLIRTVTINGTIQGLEPFNSGLVYDKTQAKYLDSETNNRNLRDTIDTTIKSNFHVPQSYLGTKFYHAMSGYSGIKSQVYNRARSVFFTGSTYGDFSWSASFAPFKPQENGLHPIPISITEGFDPAKGTVTYSWSFNNRTQNIISNSLSESLTIDDQGATPNIASIFVLGRSLGPILQDLGTYTSSSRSVTFEVVLPRPSSLRNIQFPANQYTEINNVVDSCKPEQLVYNTNAQGIRSYVKSDTTNWNPSEGRLVRSKTWEWVRCF